MNFSRCPLAADGTRTCPVDHRRTWPRSRRAGPAGGRVLFGVDASFMQVESNATVCGASGLESCWRCLAWRAPMKWQSPRISIAGRSSEGCASPAGPSGPRRLLTREDAGPATAGRLQPDRGVDSAGACLRPAGRVGPASPPDHEAATACERNCSQPAARSCGVSSWPSCGPSISATAPERDGLSVSGTPGRGSTPPRSDVPRVRPSSLVTGNARLPPLRASVCSLDPVDPFHPPVPAPPDRWLLPGRHRPENRTPDIPLTLEYLLITYSVCIAVGEKRS